MSSKQKSKNRPFQPPSLRRAASGLVILLWLIGWAVVATAAKAPELPPLTTVPDSPRLPGKFVWADLVTDNVPVARKFYENLLGWSFLDFGSYAVAANQDRPLGGLFQRARPQGTNAQPRWFGYISVPNVSKAQRAATKAGGRVLAPAKKFPKRGEQAILADPEGAVFGVVKSSAGDPEDFLPSPGDWIWMELLSRDASQAAQFYKAVAGYEVIENVQTNHGNDFVLTSQGYARGTVRTIPEANRKVRPNWLPFVRVKSITESVTLSRQLGGRVLLEPKPELFQGRLAVIADPTGAALGLMEWSHEEVKGKR